jgi:hypothetical protein
VWINQGDIVLLSLRDFQDDKADVIVKYTADEARNRMSFIVFRLTAILLPVGDFLKLKRTVNFQKTLKSTRRMYLARKMGSVHSSLVTKGRWTLMISRDRPFHAWVFNCMYPLLLSAEHLLHWFFISSS